MHNAAGRLVLEDGLAAQENRARINRFQVIDDAQQGALSRTTGADDDDDFALLDLESMPRSTCRRPKYL